ncbi:MAG: hypothetical protein K940chlam9_01536 [Chlamydiae bacterium]|nr:hypothetical protein [Chlamydiota bacterium]
MSFISDIISGKSRPPQKRREEEKSQDASSLEHSPFSADEVIEEAKTWYQVEKRQYGQRLAPAALQNTKIEGHSSLLSANYWIDVLSCWIEGKGEILPLKIRKKDLEDLRMVLGEYGETLKRYQKTNPANFLKAAEMTLKQIEHELKAKEAVYTPMGYVGGIQNEGHTIPLKIRKAGNELECIFLNEGEGVHLHPELNWSETGIRYNFQSFPILFERKILLGEKGAKLFEREILLQRISLDKNEKGYDAYDVYAPFWKLGKVHGGFDKQKISDLAKKPQVGPICADMAITLLIHDFLIDRGIPKEERQRVFLNEKLGSSICFLHSLEEVDDLDAWQLFELGIQEFSVRGLNLSGKALSEKELKICHSLVQSLNCKIQEKIQALQPTCFPLPCSIIDSDGLILSPNESSYTTTEVSLSYSHVVPKIVRLPHIGKPQAAEICKTLGTWLEAIEGMVDLGEKKRAAQTLYRLTLQLPLPLDEDNSPYWDKVPAEEIPTVLLRLHAFAKHLFKESTAARLGYIQKTVMFHTYYAIVDFLARRDPDLKLEGFASPFYFNPRDLSKKKEMFAALPIGDLHERWEEITTYFSKSRAQAPRTLFALDHSCPDIARGLKLYQKSHHQVSVSTRNKSLVDHVAYLTQFLECLKKEESLSRLGKIEALWVNSELQYLPPTYESLFYFASLSWKVSEKYHLCPQGNSIPRQSDSTKPTKSTVCYPAAFGNKRDNEASPEELLRLQGKLHETVEVEKKQLNQIWVSSKSKTNSLTVEEYRAWSEIFSKPEMQISSTLQWISLHLEDLSKPLIQTTVARALFTPSLLPKKIREEPSFLPQCRKVVLEALDYFKDRPIQGIFPSLLGILLETYTKEKDLAFLTEVESALLFGAQTEEAPAPFYSTLLLLYQHAHPRGAISLKEHVKAAFWLHYQDPDEKQGKIFDWIPQEISFSLDLPLSREEFTNQDLDWVAQTVAETTALFNLPLNRQASFRLPWILPLLGGIGKLGYVLDLNTTTIYRGEDLEEPLILLKMEGSGESPKLAWKRGQKFIVLEEDLALKEEKEEPSYRKWFEKKEYPEGWYNRILCQSNSGFLFPSGLEVWQISDTEKEEKHILWTKEGESLPAYRLEHSSFLSFFKRRGPEELRGVHLKNLKEWHHFLSTKQMEQEVSIWLSPKIVELRKLTSIPRGSRLEVKKSKGNGDSDA